jgi:CheY-like chemotaxis protein
MKKTVLFVDDDPYWSQNYQEQLRKQFTVVYKSTADGAIAELSLEKHIDLLVLDVMMDTPDSVEVAETEGGLMTGVWILETLKPLLTQKKTPVIILTNRQKNLVIEAVNALGYPKEQVTVFSKTEMSARQLPSEVQSRLG